MHEQIKEHKKANGGFVEALKEYQKLVKHAGLNIYDDPYMEIASYFFIEGYKSGKNESRHT